MFWKPCSPRSRYWQIWFPVKACLSGHFLAVSPKGGGDIRTRKSSPVSLYVEVAQSCPTLCDPMDCSLPGSSVHGILRARILEWVAMPSSRESFQPRDWTWVSCIEGRLFTIWATREAPLLVKALTNPIMGPTPKICMVTYLPIPLSLSPSYFLVPGSSCPGWTGSERQLRLLLKYLFIYLAAPGLSCCVQDLCFWHVSS